MQLHRRVHLTSFIGGLRRSRVTFIVFPPLPDILHQHAFILAAWPQCSTFNMRRQRACHWSLSNVLSLHLFSHPMCSRANVNVPGISIMLPSDWTPSKLRGNQHCYCTRQPLVFICSLTCLETGTMLTTMPVLRAFDGKVGRVLDSIDSFIVTPNSNHIPKPPLGANREVYMRENFRYGHNDPLQWPQAYVEQFLHLACICWVAPANPADILHLLYRGLTKWDFVECDPDSLVEGVGLLRRLTFLKIQSTCNIVIESMKSVDGSAPASHSLLGYLSVIELLLSRLHALPTSFLHICLTFAETQQVALELRAFVEYMTIFKPLMDSPETDAPAMPVDKGLMGAYVHDTMVLQRFFKAGIPVWCIVDMKDLPGTHVDCIDDFATSPYPQGPCPL